ncbi:MAG: hypothetical protein VXX23_00995 [Actinomycetota bacterium]|nr:hypothetical protein [Actinomycetota bacterium]
MNNTRVQERFEHANRVVNRLIFLSSDLPPETIILLQDTFVCHWLDSLEPRLLQEWKRMENEGWKMEYEWLDRHDDLIRSIWEGAA